MIHVNLVDVALDRDVDALAMPFILNAGAALDDPPGAVAEVDSHAAPALGVFHSGVAGVHFVNNALLIPLRFLLFRSFRVDLADGLGRRTGGLVI